MPSPPLILGLGEILWDVFPTGPRFGGAPANFACSAAGLAAERATVGMVSAVGRDQLGTAALRALQEHGVSTHHVQCLDSPTGQVLVQIDPHGHASYEFASEVAWDQLNWTTDLEALAQQVSVVCFGTLGQRCETSRATIQRFLRSTRPDCLRIFDINLRPPYWTESVIRESLPLASALKLNEDELPILARLLGLSGTDREILATLIQQYGLQVAALTRGAAGALLVTAEGLVSDLNGHPTSVVDTVGAGDAFTATLALGWLQKLPLDVINQWTGKVAAYVCSQPGATPPLPAELQQP